MGKKRKTSSKAAKPTTRKCDSYEEVARFLLDQFADEFGLRRVEGKQHIPGLESGTSWEIDAKGVRESDGATVIVECRRYTTSKAKQEHMAALAYRIIDTDSAGGIYVSPLGMQEGAARVAAARAVVSVELHPDSTPTDFTMSFLNKLLVGASIKLGLGLQGSVVVHRPDGTEITEELRRDA